MGWRPGKGVGPKIDRRDKAKRARFSSKVEKSMSNIRAEPESDEGSTTERFYGCSMPPELIRQGNDSSETDEDVEEAKALLAPDDVNALLCNPKENSFGLGYRGLDRNTLTPAGDHVDLFGTKLKFRMENKNLSISGQVGRNNENC